MSIRTVASFNLEHRFYASYVESSKRLASIGQRDGFVSGFFSGLSMCTMVVLMGASFYYAVWLANVGAITLTQAIAPMLVLTGAFVPMMKV